MGELYEKIVSERGGFEKILSRIPIYGGYKDAMARRQADSILREHIADKLTAEQMRLNDIAEDLAQAGNIKAMRPIREIDTRLRTLIDRIETAAQGYSGWFDPIKIGPEELEKLYAFDEAMLQYVERIGYSINAVESAVAKEEGVAEALKTVEKNVKEAAQVFSMRGDEINGTAGIGEAPTY